MALIHPVPGRIFHASMTEAHKRARQIRAREKKVAIKVRELARVEYLSESVFGKTDAVVKKTVNFNELPPFQRELAGSLVNLDELRRALHSLGWAGKKILQLGKDYRRKMRGKSDLKEITRLRKQFEKRAEDILDGVEGDVKIIKRAERALKKLPSIRKMKTVLIAGYPNVGKSSLLNELSDSKVDVQPYPFTTKSILVGYMREGYRRFQLVDTPGVLDRPARNEIEKQAVAALKHLSEKIIFVVDPSETCGYSVAEQEALKKKLEKELGADVLVVYSKADLQPATGVGGKPAPRPRGLSVSVQDKESIKELKGRIVAWFGHNT
ncbi:MAG: 50S ribosome-binding GTPase [Candidatus Diapherotrites archaeon]|nr:50S ribosome-binding GTPase [Candidatus Diapherotrites archaeon]